MTAQDIVEQATRFIKNISSHDEWDEETLEAYIVARKHLPKTERSAYDLEVFVNLTPRLQTILAAAVIELEAEEESKIKRS